MRYTYEQPEYLDKVGVVHLVQQLKIYIDGIATGDIDLSDYVTKAELQAKLDALHINIDLSAYATKEELTNALNNIDLSAYATKEYVTDAINNAQLGGDGSSVDLSIYAKKSDLDSKADTQHTHTMSDITDYTAPDLSSYAKKTDIPSLDGYALKTEIPSTDGLATTEYVDNAVANVPTGGDVDLSNYYTKTEVDTALSNVDVKADLSDYQYEPQNYKYEYLDIYGTKLGIEMPQLPTFDGGTVLHITPPDGWSNFINSENECMTVYVKKDKDREYIDVMNDDIIYNVDSEGNATPTLTIPNTTAGFLDNYIIRGTQYVPNGGTISLQSRGKAWLYDYQTTELGGEYTKYSTSQVSNGIEGCYFRFDTSGRTGSVTFNFGQYDCYVKKLSGGITKKSRNSSFTVDVSDVDTYMVIIPTSSNDDLSITYPDYTISYSDEIASGTFKIWTSDIDVVNISTQYEFTVNVKQFTDERYVRYGNEDLVKSRKPIIPTRASELLNDVPFATETYVDEKVAEIPNADLSNYYTKSETDALIPTVTNGVDGKDGTDGQDGQDGRGIVSTKFLYGYSSTPNTVPTSWSDTDSNLLLGEYRWVKVEITYSDNTTETNYISYVYNGKDGTNGTNGTNGTDGYTPVRGTDYWTQEDIDTIKAYIDTELGVIENGSY